MKVALAVCDILGFSEIVRMNPLEDIVNTYLAWLRKSLYHSIHKSEFPQHSPSLEELRSHQNLDIAWFSDTILIYTLHDSDEAVQSLISTVGWFLFEAILSSRKIRCGVAYGEAHIDNEESIFVGKPIIEAYSLEQSQAWAGGALAQSAITRLPEHAKTGELFQWWLVPYDVPGSTGDIVSSYAIDWTRGIHRPDFSIDWSSSSPKPSHEDREKMPKVVEKWKNTRAFHDHICTFCSAN